MLPGAEEAHKHGKHGLSKHRKAFFIVFLLPLGENPRRNGTEEAVTASHRVEQSSVAFFLHL